MRHVIGGYRQNKRDLLTHGLFPVLIISCGYSGRKSAHFHSHLISLPKKTPKLYKYHRLPNMMRTRLRHLLPCGCSPSSSSFSANIDSQTKSIQRLVNRLHSSSKSSTSSVPPGDDPYSSAKATHFGFEQVSEKEKAHKVKTVFENVADSYDLMNDCMSAGVHRVWKDIFIHRLHPSKNMRLVDVAGGTGDIAFRFLKWHKHKPAISQVPLPFDLGQKLPGEGSLPENEVAAQYKAMEENRETKRVLEDDVNDRSVLVYDINSKMLEVGRKRADSALTPNELKKIDWMEGDAENMSKIPDNSFDAYTIAYGIRNCVHLDKVLGEAYRVLKPGGRFMCLEFSHVPNPVVKWAYDQYSFQVIPAMGQVIAGDFDSYKYLVESIRKFPTQEEFKNMIELAGFRFVSYENLTFGVSSIHSGFKL